MRKLFTSYPDKEVITKCMPNFHPGSKDYLLLIKLIKQSLPIGAIRKEGSGKASFDCKTKEKYELVV